MSHVRAILELAVAALLGWCVLVLPVLLDPATRHYQAAVLPFMQDAVEGVKLYSLALLFLLGLFFGVLGKAPAWAVGCAAVASFPAWSAIDMAMGGDHNLFPIEWLIYGFYGALAIGGAYLGRVLRKGRRREHGVAAS